MTTLGAVDQVIAIGYTLLLLAFVAWRVSRLRS